MHCPVGRINVLRAVALAGDFCAATPVMSGRDLGVVGSRCGALKYMNNS